LVTVAVAQRRLGPKSSATTDTFELLLMPLVLSFALSGDEWFELHTLFPEGEHVRLGPGVTVPSAVVRSVLTGRSSHVLPGDIDVAWIREFRAAGERLLREGLTAGDTQEKIDAARRLVPKLHMNDVIEAEKEAGQLVEQRAAGRLGVEPFFLAIAARRLWGHGFSTERDRRVQLAAPDARAAGAVAGHVTRALIGDVLPVLEEAGFIPSEKRKPGTARRTNRKRSR